MIRMCTMKMAVSLITGKYTSQKAQFTNPTKIEETIISASGVSATTSSGVVKTEVTSSGVSVEDPTGKTEYKNGKIRHNERYLYLPEVIKDENGAAKNETLATENYVDEKVKRYRHQIIGGDFSESGGTKLYIISPNATPMTLGTDATSHFSKADTKMYIIDDGILYSQVLCIVMPYTIYYLNEQGAVTSKNIPASVVDKVTEL